MSTERFRADDGSSAVYRRGQWPAIVVPGAVLVIFGEIAEQDLADLSERVAAADSPREAVATVFGGAAADLLGAPDFTLAMMVEHGVHVAVRGPNAVTVCGADGELTTIDGANAIVCGEQTFATVRSLEVAGPDEAAGALLPIGDGVVFVSEIRWGAVHDGETSTGPQGQPEPAPAPAPEPQLEPESEPPAESQEVTETQAPTETKLPVESTDPTPVAAFEVRDPAPTFQVPVVREPVAVPQFEPATTAQLGVEHTVGGGVDYASLMRGAARVAEPAFPARRPAEPIGAPPVPQTDPPPVGRPGDHDGNTSGIVEVQAALASMTGAATGPVDEPGDLVLSRVCTQKHANPPHATMCRLCGVPLEGDAVQVRRPAMGSIRLSTGMFFELDRPLVIGRGPRADQADPRNAPRLISLPSPGKEISRSHLRVDLDGWNVLAVDLGSTNGTFLRRGGFDDRRLMSGQPQMLTDGDVLVVEDITIRFEGLP